MAAMHKIERRAEGRLGILAGGGELPGKVAAAAQRAGQDVFLIGFEGFAEAPVLAPYPHQFVRVGAAGQILSLLRAQGCKDLVLVGPVRRPSIMSLRPDAEGVRILARIGRAAFMGDDGLLAAVVRVLGEEGFRVLGAHEVLKEALGAAGLLGSVEPDDQARSDIGRAVEVARALGEQDVGQGCIVQQGIVLAVEAIEGTDAMIARAAGLARPGPGGILLKMVKPNQDRRADLPTIGPNTISAAAQAGLRGIAFEAGGTLLTDAEACRDAANQHGLFLIGIDPTIPG